MTTSQKAKAITAQHIAGIVVIALVCVPLEITTNSWIPLAVQFVLFAGALVGQHIRLKMTDRNEDD